MTVYHDDGDDDDDDDDDDYYRSFHIGMEKGTTSRFVPLRGPCQEI